MAGERSGQFSDELVQQLFALNGTVLTTLPQDVGRLGSLLKSQRQLHAHERVLDRALVEARLTQEPSIGEDAELAVLAEVVAESTIDVPSLGESRPLLLDRGGRSTDLFNRLHNTEHDDIAPLTRTDG